MYFVMREEIVMSEEVQKLNQMYELKNRQFIIIDKNQAKRRSDQLQKR